MTDEFSHANAWAQRSDAYRTKNVSSFQDFINVIDATYRTFNRLYECLGPYNAKQMGSNMPYIPPTREFVQEMIKRKPRDLSDFVFSSMITSSIKYCEQYKGKRQLITPHPSSHHSAHYPEGTFKIKKLGANFPELNKNHNNHFKPSNLGEITFDGINYPVYLENIKDKHFRYVIVRPKLGKLGTANVENWEVLLFTKNYGFYVDHTDSNLNPRYSGIY